MGCADVFEKTGRLMTVYRVEEDGHRALQLSLLGQGPAVEHLFGLRGRRPLEVLAKRLGVQNGRIAPIRQVHGDSIGVIDSPAGGHGGGQEWTAETATQAYDALITNQIGLAITIQTADCLPILIWDANRKVVAAVHAGWRGSLKEIAPKTVFRMQAGFGR